MATDNWNPHQGGGNDFFLPTPSVEGPAGRLYAAFEMPEIDEERAQQLHPGQSSGAEPVYLECVGANWIDTMNALPSNQFWREVPLSVVAVKPEWWQQYLPRNAPAGTIVWFEIDVRPAPPAEANGMQFHRLLNPGINVEVRVKANGTWRSPLGPQHWLQTNEAVPMEAVIRRVQKYANKTSGVVVFDVGQGASQALMRSNDIHLEPVLYVDVGGGVMQNLATFPEKFEGFKSLAPIILSHWDWDHWSSVSRFPELLENDWIAPLPPDKPIQQALAWILNGLGRLSLWLPGIPNTYQTKHFRLERCTGRTSNDSGIAVTLFGGTKGSKSCLLPGDANYRHVPSVHTERFNALSISHHGGRLYSKMVPNPKRGAKAACSVGAGNSYKHPFWETIHAHHDKGWPTPVSTGYFGHRPSHVYLPWEGKLRVVTPCPTCDDNTKLRPDMWPPI